MQDIHSLHTDRRTLFDNAFDGCFRLAKMPIGIRRDAELGPWWLRCLRAFGQSPRYKRSAGNEPGRLEKSTAFDHERRCNMPDNFFQARVWSAIANNTLITRTKSDDGGSCRGTRQ